MQDYGEFALEGCQSRGVRKQNLMEHSVGMVEHKNVKRPLGKGSLAHEMSEVSKGSIWNWVRDRSGSIWQKNLAVSCLFPAN